MLGNTQEYLVKCKKGVRQGVISKPLGPTAEIRNIAFVSITPSTDVYYKYSAIFKQV